MNRCLRKDDAMTKAVFRPGEITVGEAKIFLAPPTSFPELAHLTPAEDALEELMISPWPGNVRQLRNCIVRAQLLAGDRPISQEHIRI